MHIFIQSFEYICDTVYMGDHTLITHKIGKFFHFFQESGVCDPLRLSRAEIKINLINPG